MGIDKLREMLIGICASKSSITKALENVDFNRYIKAMDKEVFIEDIVKLLN